LFAFFIFIAQLIREPGRVVNTGRVLEPTLPNFSDLFILDTHLVRANNSIRLLPTHNRPCGCRISLKVIICVLADVPPSASFSSKCAPKDPRLVPHKYVPNLLHHECHQRSIVSHPNILRSFKGSVSNEHSLPANPNHRTRTCKAQTINHWA
jgi:hypothetical protein